MPLPGDVYSVGALSYSVKKFRCISCRLKDDFTCEVEGIQHDPDTYDVSYTIDSAQSQKTYYNLDTTPQAVTDLDGESRQTKDSGGTNYYINLDVSWNPMSYAFNDESIVQSVPAYYRVFYQKNGETNWRYAGTTGDTHFVIQDVESSATYNVKVIAYDGHGRSLTIEDSLDVAITT